MSDNLISSIDPISSDIPWRKQHAGKLVVSGFIVIIISLIFMVVFFVKSKKTDLPNPDPPKADPPKDKVEGLGFWTANRGYTGGGGGGDGGGVATNSTSSTTFDPDYMWLGIWLGTLSIGVSLITLGLY